MPANFGIGGNVLRKKIVDSLL